MVNEEKIKLMTKMAIYESKEGKRDLEISHFHIRQYIHIETVQTFILNTIAYCIVVGLGVLLFLDKIMDLIRHHGYIKLTILLILVYLVFITVEVVYTRIRAKRRYEEAVPRVWKYKKNLTRLYYMNELKEETETMKPEKLEQKLEEELDAETIEF
ncbi:MAG: hypothetical protein Q4D45_05265 [Lachnospiraceae bacterium]|nr:hypothetical protein [Lachnospiraceae bacterium]